MSDKLAPMLTYCGSTTAAGLSVWGSAGVWLVESHKLISSIGILVGAACAITGIVIQIKIYRAKRKRGEL